MRIKKIENKIKIENIRNKIVIIVSHSNVFGNIVDNIYEVKKNDIIIKEGREYGD